LTFDCQKLPKIYFFQKNENFWQFFFLQNCQVFGNFLTVNWQFSGGSGWDRRTTKLVVFIEKKFALQKSGSNESLGSNWVYWWKNEVFN